MFNPGSASLRPERWRYIRYADGSEELYDHYGGPNKWDNLAGSHQYSEQLEELRNTTSPFLKEK